MKFEVGRDAIRVIPETKADEAYIEDTLGLREDQAAIRLVRVNAMGLSCVAYLHTERERPRVTSDVAPR